MEYENHTNEEKWYEPLNKVTKLSKTLAAILFLLLPILMFWIGFEFGQAFVLKEQWLETFENNRYQNTVRERVDTTPIILQDPILTKYKHEEFGAHFALPQKWSGALIEYKVFESNTERIDLSLERERGGQLVFESACNFSKTPIAVWNRWPDDPHPVLITMTDTFVYGWSCGHDDGGFVNFEEFNGMLFEGRYDEVGVGTTILGPYGEFKELILPTFELLEPPQEMSSSSDFDGVPQVY